MDHVTGIVRLPPLNNSSNSRPSLKLLVPTQLYSPNFNNSSRRTSSSVKKADNYSSRFKHISNSCRCRLHLHLHRNRHGTNSLTDTNHLANSHRHTADQNRVHLRLHNAFRHHETILYVTIATCPGT